MNELLTTTHSITITDGYHYIGIYIYIYQQQERCILFQYVPKILPYSQGILPEKTNEQKKSYNLYIFWECRRKVYMHKNNNNNKTSQREETTQVCVYSFYTNLRF